MNKRLFNLIKVVVVLGIVGLILYGRIDLRELIDYLRGIPGRMLLSTWLALGGIWLLTAFRWQSLVRVQRIAVGYWRLLEFVLIGLFFNNIMLGSMGGDVFKAYYLARKSPSRKEAAVSTVLADRIVAFLSLFLIGSAGLFLNRGNRALWPAAFLFAFLFLAVIAVLAVIFQRSLLGKIPLVARLLDRLPFQRSIRQFYEAFYAYRHHKSELLRALGIAVALQVLFIAIIFYLARAMGMRQVAFRHLLLLTPLCAMAFALPILPAGWGIGDVSFVGLFGLLGVSTDRALALDLVLRAMAISWSLAGGILYARPCWRVPAEKAGENGTGFEEPA